MGSPWVTVGGPAVVGCPTMSRSLWGRSVFAVLVGCVTAAGCSSSGGKGGATAPTGVVARFTLSGDTAPNYLDVPFPSDVYLANGKIVDPLPGLDAVVRLNTQF